MLPIWTEIWLLWSQLEERTIVMLKQSVRDYLNFVKLCIILLELGNRRWVHGGHKGVDMVSKNTQVGCVA